MRLRCRYATILFYAAGGGDARSADKKKVGASRHKLKRIAHGARRIAAAQMESKAE